MSPLRGSDVVSSNTFYNNITPTGFHGGVDSFLLQYHHPFGVGVLMNHSFSENYKRACR